MMSWRGVALKSSKPTKTTRGQVWPLSQQKKKDEQEEGEMVGGHSIGSFKALGLRLRWRRGQHIS
jgi:hypothetical protein